MEQRVLSALARVFEALGVQQVLIGALAANRYRSTARLTQDVEMLIADPGPALAGMRRALADAGWEVRWESPEHEMFRLEHRELGPANVLVVRTEYQREAISRARLETLDEGIEISVLSAEDVIVHKLIAGRAQDIADIEAILASDPELDHAYIERWAGYWEVEECWTELRD